MQIENAFDTVTHQPQDGRRYFTLEQANSALTYVRRVADDIADRYQGAVAIRQKIELASPFEQLDTLRDDYEQIMDQLNDLIDELTLVGVELKDFERGLIDFPSMHEGREVSLCWQRGEKSITVWHEVDAGFSGRQDITLLKQPTQPKKEAA